MITPSTSNWACHYSAYLAVLLTVSQVYPILPLISFVVVFDGCFPACHARCLVTPLSVSAAVPALSCAAVYCV